MSSRRPSKVWHRKPGSGQMTLPETERDERIWRTDLGNGFIVEEVGAPAHRLPAEPQAVLTSEPPEPPQAVPMLAAKVPLPDIPTVSAADRMRNHRAITREA